MFKIDKNIPLPTKKYPLEELEVGDSFFIPLTKGELQDIRNKINPAIARVKHATEKKFLTRKAIKNKIPGIRVWRIK